MKFVRLILFASLSLFILANPCYPQTNTLRLTPSDLYNHLEKYLGHRRDTEWAKYKGKLIRWTGNPRLFGTRGITDHGFLLDLCYKGHLVWVQIRAYFPEKEAEKLFKVSQYDSVIFEGRLSRYCLGSLACDYHFLVENAKLIKVNVARRRPSIVGYKFQGSVSSLSGGYELRWFTVTLRNDGQLPLTGASLMVVLGDMICIERNIFLRPSETREINLWPFGGEWIIKGQKKIPYEIPVGHYKGTIELRDESGRVIASQPFSCNIPPNNAG